MLRQLLLRVASGWRSDDIDAEYLTVRKCWLALRPENVVPFMEKVNSKKLIMAAYSGHLPTVQDAIKAGVDLDASDNSGMTALHWAASRGHADIAEELLKSGADAQQKDKNGQSAFDRAVRQGHHKIVVLIQKYALSVREVMFAAASRGDLNVLQRALLKGADPNAKDKNGRLVLGVASQAGHTQIVDALLRNGARVNAVDDNDWTALGLATHAGKAEAVKPLLSNGAKVHLYNGKQGSALTIAVSQNNRQIAQLLQNHRLATESREYDIRADNLLEAVHTKNEPLLHHLLRQGVNPNATNVKNVPALELASHRGYTSFVDALLAAGANPNSPNGSQFCPLSIAVSTGQSAVVDSLLRYGANPNHQSEKGVTPLGLAIDEGDLEVLDLLLEAGADTNFIDVVGDTRLHRALHEDQDDIFEALLEHGANPNIENVKGLSSLEVAAYTGKVNLVEKILRCGVNNKRHLHEALVAAVIQNDPQVVEVLLRNSVDPNQVDVKGHTLLGWAASDGYIQIARLLLDYGSNPNITEKAENGSFTALHQATESGHIGIVKLLLERGADPDIEDGEGETAFEVAVSREKLDIAFILDNFVPQGPVAVAPQINNISEQALTQKQSVNVNSDLAIGELLSALHNLTGLMSVKTDVAQLVNFLQVQQLRRARGLSTTDQSLHMVFTGNPGTGKTTIARLIAQIYKSLGVLSKGQFVETDRAGLIGGFLGQTAIKTKEVVESAIGGVLFIDEAYSLTEDTYGRDMYGQEAVATLLKLMEDHRDGLIVIVAGYTEPMQKFIRSNPGLQSRFNKFLHFDDYAPAELTEIFRHFAAQGDYTLHPATELKLTNVFSALYAQRDETFGNARLARNLFEKAINAHANRMVSLPAPDEASLVTLYPEDVPRG